MRADSIGLFWEDLPKPVAPPRTPPSRTWEEPGYLPRLAEAKAFQFPLFTADEINAARLARDPLVFDLEVFPNYFLAAFRSVTTGKGVYFEMEDFETEGFLNGSLRWWLENFQTVTFNGNAFDLPIAALAIAGRSCAQLKVAVDKLIREEMQPYLLLRGEKVKALEVDSIDLYNVAPGEGSLKLLAGRLHAPRLQDLPFPPDRPLTPDQITIVRYYCLNGDLPNTALLYKKLKAELDLRAKMGPLYGLDLRSKSDAQMAESLLCSELKRETGVKPQRPVVIPGTTFRYNPPPFISFQTGPMREALATIKTTDFAVREEGGVELPSVIEALKIKIGEATYSMGIGGLHSNERSVYHYADETMMLIDRDVASYYPAIILNLGLYPTHLGPAFLRIYRGIVERRLAAKKAGNKTEADTLKIAVNGTFGKLGSKWSPLYAPDLLIQVTLTGQLVLLMLIERLESDGFQICSANTDGFIIKCRRDREWKLEAHLAIWEKMTGFVTEESQYRFICSRDVNNYIAVKTDGSLKLKGAFAEESLARNPTALIAKDAAIAWLKDQAPVATTIRACRDIRRFVCVRTVNGGAVKDGEYLGKAIRWYWAAGEMGEIVCAKNGNKVPDSDGARPVMDLPETFPDDVDFARYEAVAVGILRDVGIEL